jgi:galactokinase
MWRAGGNWLHYREINFLFACTPWSGNLSSPDSIAELIRHLKTDAATFLKEGHPEVHVARAPGRLDVMGGLAEYSGSLACQYPMEASGAVAVQRRDDRKLVLRNYNLKDSGGAETVTLSLDDFYGTAALLPNRTQQKLFAGHTWAAHVAGAYPTLAKYKKLTRRAHGANIACYSDLPPSGGAGAALECATLWALTAAYHLILEPLEIALLALKIEDHLVGRMAGVLEPATAVLGRKDQLLLWASRPHEQKGYLGLPKGLMVAGLYIGEPENGGLRAARVSALLAQGIISRFFAEMGVRKDPTGGYLANIKAEVFARYFRQLLPETLEGGAYLKEYGGIADRMTQVEPGAVYFPRAAAEFQVMENARTEAFVGHVKGMAGLPAAERRGPAGLAGKLMLESHRACAREARVGHAGADLLVELVAQQDAAAGMYGARLACGGIVTVLLEESAIGHLEEVVQKYQEKSGERVQVLNGSSAGAAEAAPRRLSIAELLASR